MLHPSWVKNQKLEKTEMILWMLEDSDSGKDEILPKERERIILALAKEKEQENMEKMVRNHKDMRTHRKLKISVEIAGKQVTNTRIAGDGHSNRMKDTQILLEKEMMRRANQAKVVARKENPKMPEHLREINSRVQQQARWHRLHHGQKQAQRLAQLTRLSAHRKPRWIAFNVDTRAGGTVWPLNADYACEKISGPGGRNYKTATGEMVEGQGRFRVRCRSIWGHQLHMTSEKTSVHKPLLSAGDVTDKGHALWLDGDVGYIIQKDSPILGQCARVFREFASDIRGMELLI